MTTQPHKKTALPGETPEEHRKRIAQIAEESCHLEGNINDPDFEEFANKYGIGKDSDFV